ncbi:MAG: hypothetical protein M3Z01_09605 [Thermoproteota archaeon]|nr:hypothetical protein [Thermoproteota archaeon]
MKAKIGHVNEDRMIIKLFASNYARDLMYTLLYTTVNLGRDYLSEQDLSLLFFVSDVVFYFIKQ